MSGGTWDESKHPRVPAGSGDPSGEFTASDGGVSGERETLRGMFARVHKPDGGFTYQPRIHFEPRTGYVVSVYPERSWAKRVNQMTMLDIAKFMVHNIDLLKKNDHYLGGWHDRKSHKVFLDVSIVVGSAARAHELALRHDQKAYYDLSKGTSVYVNPHARSGGVGD